MVGDPTIAQETPASLDSRLITLGCSRQQNPSEELLNSDWNQENQVCIASRACSATGAMPQRVCASHSITDFTLVHIWLRSWPCRWLQGWMSSCTYSICKISQISNWSISKDPVSNYMKSHESCYWSRVVEKIKKCKILPQKYICNYTWRNVVLVTRYYVQIMDIRIIQNHNTLVTWPLSSITVILRSQKKEGSVFFSF